MTRRTLQVGEMMREELTDIIRREVNDPRVGFFSITEIEVSPDIRNARVFVSVLGDETERAETMTALRSAASFIRVHLKPRLHTRNIPELEFRDDRSMEHAEQIARAINRLHEDDAERARTTVDSGNGQTSSVADGGDRGRQDG